MNMRPSAQAIPNRHRPSVQAFFYLSSTPKADREFAAQQTPRSEQARRLFAEAIELRPGLSDDRLDQGQRYHAYADYAVAKDLLKNRRFDEAQAAVVLAEEAGAVGPQLLRE